MRDLADLKCYLTCRLEIAKSYLLQVVEPGTPQEAEQWMIRGRMHEIEKMLEKLAEIKDGCVAEPYP